MEASFSIGREVFAWGVIPILICVARIVDVSIGTIRIIFIGRGNRFVAPFLGFFEVLIWLFAIRQIMQNLTNVFYYVAYAGGFAVGTFVGMYIEEKLAMGNILVRVITSKNSSELVELLTAEDYGVTRVKAHGARGDVDLVYTIIKRGDLRHVVDIINSSSPKAFYTVEDVRLVREGIFPMARQGILKEYLSLLRIRKKGK